MKKYGNKKYSKQLHDGNPVVQHVTSSKSRAAREVRAHVQIHFVHIFAVFFRMKSEIFLRQRVLLVYLAASTQLKR